MKYKGLTKKDLDFIDWKISDIKKIPAAYKKHKTEEYKKIKSIKPEDRTFENTVLALENSGGEVSELVSKIHISRLMGIGDKKYREEVIRIEEEVEKISIELSRDEDIYKALKEYSLKKDKLNKSQKKLVDDYLVAFEKMGFSLPKSKQNKIKSIQKRIAKLQSSFDKNLINFDKKYVLKKDSIAGLSENFLNTLEKDKKGNYVIKMIPSQTSPLLDELESSSIRKEVFDINVTKGGEKNLEILTEIIKLRKQKAKILGFDNHCDLVLSSRMAKNLETVENFLYDIKKKVTASASKESKDILKFASNFSGKNLKRINYWDKAFYITQMEKQRYDLDPEKLREYFPAEHVLREMLDIFSGLFGIEFKKKKVRLWHEDAEMFAVIDKKTKKVISYLAMDLFPREGKYGHACATGWRVGHLNPKNQNEYMTPLACFVCNFRKPTKDMPSLLSPDEITTMFHEFGHTMHNCLTNAKYKSQSGTSVSWDFVELPSQLLENWFYNEKSLKKLSKHYKTGDVLPKSDIQNILDSKKFLISSFVLRQLQLGILDIDLYSKSFRSPKSVWKKIVKETSGSAVSRYDLFPASFHHIVDGYDSGYYSYKWALVYSDDIFSEFQKHGIFSKKIGMKYRKEILEVGSSRDEMESLKAFLGRKPNNKAFLKNIKSK